MVHGKYERSSDSCNERTVQKTGFVKLESLLGAFEFYALGLGTAGIVLIIEIVLKYFVTRSLE